LTNYLLQQNFYGDFAMTKRQMICVADIKLPVFPKPNKPDKMINILKYTELDCDHCGSKLLKSNYRISKAKNHFCSRNCSDLWKKTAFVGENNPQYGKKANKETKQKQSIAMKQQWKNPAYVSKVLSNREKALKEYQQVYGVSVGWSPESRQRRKDSFIRNFGYEHNWSSPESRQKCEESTIRLYGSGSLEIAQSAITEEVIEQRRRTLIETRTGKSYEEYEAMMPERDAYYRDVRRITEQQPIHLLEHSEKRGVHWVMENAYHLDHIIPINYGFLNGIPAEEIGHISNLRFIPWLENIQKSDKLLED